MPPDPARPVPAPDAGRSGAAGPRAAPWLLGYRVLCSLRLTVVLLLLLLWLTWRGTLAQVDVGLLEAQKKYFDSIFFIQDVGPLRVPFPGAYLVLSVLAVNLICGGVVRMRKSRSTAGILVVHAGVLLMLAAGLVKFEFADDGYIRFFPGQVADEYVSFTEWEVVAARPAGEGTVREFVIPAEEFTSLDASQSRLYRHPDLPFTLTLSQLQRNSMAVDARASMRRGRVIDGYTLEQRPLDAEAERNIAGAYADVRENDGTTHEGILWGWQKAQPMVFRVGDVPWSLALRKKHFPLGYGIRLEQFTKTDHPGVDKAKDFRSRVTRLEDGVEHTVEISMNEPMRHEGRIFYQSQWAPGDADSGGALYSVLSVSRNPSDRWPLYSCIVITLGLVLHFGRKLVGFAREQAARRST